MTACSTLMGQTAADPGGLACPRLLPSSHSCARGRTLPLRQWTTLSPRGFHLWLLSLHALRNPVERASGKGAQVDSAELICLASVLATRRLNDVQVATPRTHPSIFWRAVMVACMKERVTPGVSALAKSSAAEAANVIVSASSRHTRSSSFVPPPLPEALPDGAIRKHFTNTLTSNWRGTSGTKSITCLRNPRPFL